MKFYRIILVLAIFFSLGQSPIFSQTQALQNLINGKKAFWEAKFNRALSSLNKVISEQNIKDEYMFEAHLYTGFILVRQNATNSEINASFGNAVRLQPGRELDEMIIPPDLIAPFNEVRNSLVGCLYIESYPPEVNIVGVNADSILFTETTPFMLCDLNKNDYQLLISELGYQEEFMPIKLVAGRVDTLLIQLIPILERSQKKSTLKWILSGSALIAGSAILYTTVLSGDDGGGGTGTGETLPGPPVRPGVQ